VAALCATPERRLALTERTVHAIALERSVIKGTANAQPGAHSLSEDIADHLRALLRDVICGHLDTDLVGLADELLLGEPPASHEEPEARSTEPVAGGSEPELVGDAGEAEEILDLLI
jgi:hypothetical protein